ncbi:MAG: ABC transporter permease [Verrucomicrobia bacterium]|nr:ABC transporter permease [Verrucomicrobiota bacterium]
MNDTRFALRMLAKAPGFTIVAVFTLALGIGANTAIFSVVNALLLKPLPFPEPQQLVAFGMTNTREKGQTSLGSLSYPDFFDFRTQNHTLTSIAAYRDQGITLTSEQGAISVHGIKTSAELFDVLGIKPVIGRTFSRDDEQAGGGPGGFKVILTDAFWRQHFGGDPNVIGRTIELDRQLHTVIGVMPPRFQYPIQSDRVEIYLTIAGDAANPDGTKPATQERGMHSLQAIARLKTNVTIEQAQAELSAIAANLEKQYPDTNSFFGVRFKPLREELVGDVRAALYILFGAVVCVLLIANANVANLLLARASVRGKEIALRGAVGANRARIIRQLLTESVILAGLGGLGGLIVAQWGTEGLIRIVPQDIPRIAEIKLDGVVLAFTFLVSVTTGLIFGLVPAWQASQVDLNSSLKSGTRIGVGEHKARLRNGLIMGEVALALVLLICAGLLIQTFSKLGNVQPGFRTERLLTASIQLPRSSYPKNENVIAFYDQFLERVRTIAGVQSASVILPLPLTRGNLVTDFDIEEHPLPEGQRPGANVRMIGTDYFQTMGIPVLQGRVFDQNEQLNSPPVVIVNQRFVDKFFPGQNVIGKRIKPGFAADDNGEKMREIIGVVGNVKHQSLKNVDSPEMYLSQTQMPPHIMSIVIRTKVSDPATVTSSIRRELAAIDPAIPLTSVRVFDEYISRSLAQPRFNAFLLSIFAGSALLLTAIGIYGVMAYSVAQRTNEIGIRMALGAAQSNIFKLVIGQAMTVVGISIVIGLVGAFAAARLLNSLLFGISAWDPLTFSAIVILISLVAFLAAWLPARRASNVDPIVALRTD